MKKFKNRIIPLVMIVGALALLLGGCGKSNEKLSEIYSSDGSSLHWLLLESVDNYVSTAMPKDQAKEAYMEGSQAAIDTIKSYNMKTKEGKAVKESALLLSEKERDFYLKYDYGDYTGEKPNIREELKKYYDDLDSKIDKFYEKFHKEVGEDIYWD